jgi:putative heme-binding domain-containing protein
MMRVQPNDCAGQSKAFRPASRRTEHAGGVRSPAWAVGRQAVLWAILLCAFAIAALAQSLDQKTELALEALGRLSPDQVNANPKLQEALKKVLDATRGTPRFVQLVEQFQLKNQNAGLLEVAVKNSSTEAGVAAVRLILAGGDSGLLCNALAGTNAVSIAEALGNTADKQAVPLLEPLVTENKRDAALRKQAVRSLARTQEGARLLLQLAREDKLPADVRFTAAVELNGVRWPKIKSEAAEVLPLPQGQNAQPLPPLAELVKMKGDPTKGAGIFRRETVACIKCHQVNGEGTDFGPNLSEIGTKLGKDALVEAILDPSAGISFGYEAWQIELKNGEELFGLIVSDSADELALKDQRGIVTRLKKSDLAKRTQQKLSIMPAGLQQAMSTQDIVDLLEYLSSLKKP